METITLALIYAVTFVSLIVAFGIYVIETNKEKAKLINALIAKTPEQARDLNMADKVQPIKIKQEPAPSPDVVPLDSLDDDEFDKHIKDSIGPQE